MWTYFVSVYFLQNRDTNNGLNDDEFYAFLKKITAFIWTYAVRNPGVNALRTPVYAEMVNIVNGKPVTFDDFKFESASVEATFSNFNFYNGRPITKSMLTWWSLEDVSQPLPSIETVFEIEHIFARNRQDKEKTLSNVAYLDLLGNKALLEKKINIRASDYRFSDKIKYYQGYINSRNQKKDGTIIRELLQLSSSSTDFSETDIIERNQLILNSFISYLKDASLLI